MTPEEIGNMTLDDLEAMAQRFGAAVKTIREAQALLGGSRDAPSPPLSTFMPTVAQPIQRGAPNPLLTPAENAERQRLIRQNTMSPDDLEAMERK